MSASFPTMSLKISNHANRFLLGRVDSVLSKVSLLSLIFREILLLSFSR